MTGSTATAPYTVAGRTLGANVSFGGADHAGPVRRGPGAVRHRRHAGCVIRRRPGRPARRSPRAPATPPRTLRASPRRRRSTRPPPVLVAAKTADLSTPVRGNVPNGTDRRRAHHLLRADLALAGRVSPFSLNVAGRTETNIEGDSGAGDRTLYVQVTEAASPDGGLTPERVGAGGGPGRRPRSRTAPLAPNEALAMTFARHHRRGQPGAAVRAARRAAGRRLHEGRRQRHRRRGRLRPDHLVRAGRARRRRCRAVLALLERLGDRGRRHRPARPVDHARDPAHRLDGEGPRQPGHDRLLQRRRGHARRRRRRGRRTRRSTAPRPPRRPARTSGLEGNDARDCGQPRADDDGPVVPAQVRLRRRLVQGRDRPRRAISSVLTRPAAGVDLDFEVFARRRQQPVAADGGRRDRRRRARSTGASTRRSRPTPPTGSA